MLSHPHEGKVRSMTPVIYERAFCAQDHRFTLRSDIAGAGPVLDRLFEPFAAAPDGRSPAVYEILKFRRAGRRHNPAAHDLLRNPKYELLVNGNSTQRSSSPGSMLDWVIADVTESAVSAPVGYAAVHASAGVIGGRALLMPAPPEHGKTTTIAALVRAGWGFLTDEAALISLDDGLVHPFPRPLMISPSSMAVLPGLRDRLPDGYEAFRHFDHHVAPNDLRPDCVSRPARAGFIVFPCYAKGSRTVLTPMARAEALMELLGGCFNLPALGTPGMEALSGVVRDAACYRLSIGAIGPAVHLIRRLLEERTKAAFL